eukprot:556996_1
MAFTALLLSLALITLVSLGSCDSFDSFTSSLESLMCNSGLSVGGSKCSNQTYGLQDFVYSFSDYFDDETTNASIQAQSIIGRLNTAIELRGTMLRNISEMCKHYVTNTTRLAIPPWAYLIIYISPEIQIYPLDYQMTLNTMKRMEMMSL